MVPPRPIATPLSYPEAASGSATVVLELTIDAEGRVESVRAISGEGPFRDAALDAAKRFVFEPAMRAGRAVPSRIRYVAEFTPPAEPEPEPEAGPAAAAPERRLPPPAVVPARPAIVGVTVEGQRAPTGSVTLRREEARLLPGSFGDPLRAIEAQPGVVPIVSGLPAFFIRGAPPANVGFFFDGVDLPLLYHAFFGPSVIHPSFIDNIEFYAGASPASYGRFAGPVVAVNASPPSPETSGEITVRLIDAGGIVQSGPLSSCSTVDCVAPTARAAGRYSYAGLVLSLLSDAELDYWDYQVSASAPVGRSDSLGVLAFGGYDHFRPPQASVNSGADLAFHRVDLRWDHRIGVGSNLRVALTAGYDQAAGAGAESSIVTDHSLRLRSELVRRFSSRTVLKAGMDTRLDRFGLETSPRRLDYPDFATLFPSRVDTVSGGYLSLELEPAKGIHVAPGLRADVYSSQGVGAVGVDPRISAAFDVSRVVRLEQSFGIAHQRPNFAAQVPGAQVADLAHGLQQALLASAGIRFKLPEEITASATAFRSAYFHALDPLGGARDFTIDRTSLDRRSTVSAAGLELSLNRSLAKRLGGFVSYTLSRSQHSTGAVESPSGFDRTHVLQGGVSYDLGHGFRVGARGVFYSGIPELYLQGTPRFLSDRRGTPFFRLDLRGEKRFRIGKRGYLSFVAEVLNATSTAEVVRLDCGEICRERTAGPVILPSIGAEAGY